MSLDTVIKIGGFYREVPDSWKFHDQVNWIMNDVSALAKNKDKEGNSITPVFYEINVTENENHFFFDLDNKKEITDEDKKKSLYYLNFKENAKDGTKKYILGDIFYSYYKDKKDKWIENGNYRMLGIWSNRIKNGIEEKKSSFWLSEKVAKNMNNEFIQKFRTEFRNKANQIEAILRQHLAVVLHFNFNGKRWLDQNGIINSIDTILTQSLVKEHTDKERVVLDKYLYKTLGGTVPGFHESNTYKSRLFTREEIINLMYAGKAAEKPIIRFGNIGILALPHSENLTAGQVVNFFERKDTGINKKVEEEVKKETNLTDSSKIKISEEDPFFTEIIHNDFENTVKFDIVFTSIPGSPAGVYADLLEISDVEKSQLIRVSNKISEVKQQLQEQYDREMPEAKKELVLTLQMSFYKIFGDTTKDKKKFQSHLLQVLPKIYTDTYYEDPLLLPAFLEKAEFNVRNDGAKYNFFKYDFYFLMNIQKNNPMKSITESQSYHLGINLGIMAKQFAAWKPDCPMKQFEKSYVGNLSRRISSLDEFVKFSNYVNEKLIIHKRLYKTEKEAYLEIMNSIKNFKEKYNKQYCSLGFFEGYYQKDNENTKNINEN